MECFGTKAFCFADRNACIDVLRRIDIVGRLWVRCYRVQAVGDVERDGRGSEL